MAWFGRGSQTLFHPDGGGGCGRGGQLIRNPQAPSARLPPALVCRAEGGRVWAGQGGLILEPACLALRGDSSMPSYFSKDLPTFLSPSLGQQGAEQSMTGGYTIDGFFFFFKPEALRRL